MNYPVEMGSRSMISAYVPSFIKIGSGIQQLIGEIHRHTNEQSKIKIRDKSEHTTTTTYYSVLWTKCKDCAVS
jgi:hypothetical protein